MDGKFIAFVALAMATTFGGTWWYINRPPPEPDIEGPSRAVSPPMLAEDGRVMTFSDCAEVRAKGKAPLLAGSPGYKIELDPDGDGVACPPTNNEPTN